MRRTRPPPDGRISTISAFALGHLLHNDAGVCLVDIDDNLLDRFEQFARVGSCWNSTCGRDTDELEAFAPHGLDQHAELQFAAAGDFACESFSVDSGDAQRDVGFRLAQQPLANHAALHLVALGSRKRPLLMRNVMVSVGGSIGCAGSGSVTSGAHSVCETEASGRPAMATMSPANPSSTAPLQAAEGQHLGDAALLDLPP